MNISALPGERLAPLGTSRVRLAEPQHQPSRRPLESNRFGAVEATR